MKSLKERIKNGEKRIKNIKQDQIQSEPETMALVDTSAAYVPNADNLGRCFDISKLDPFSLSDDLNQQIFTLFDEDGNGISENGVAHKSSNYAEYSNIVKRIYHAYSLEESFAKTISAGGGVPMFCTFSISKTYTSTEKETGSKEQLYTFTDYLIKTDELDILYNIYDVNELPLNDAFAKLVANLPKEYTENEAAYENFIAQCGTHFSSQVTFGGRAYQRIFISNSSYKKMVEEGIDINVEASGTFKKVTGSAGYDSSSNSAKTFESETGSTQESVVYSGGSNFGSLGEWQSSVLENPMPVDLTLVLISELFTSSFFPDDELIENKKSSMETAVQNYLDGISLSSIENLLQNQMEISFQWAGDLSANLAMTFSESTDWLILDSKDGSNIQTWIIDRKQTAEERVEGGDQLIYGSRDSSSRTSEREKESLGQNVIRYGDIVTLQNKSLSEKEEEYTIGEDDKNMAKMLTKNGYEFKIWSALDPLQEDNTWEGRAIALGDSIMFRDINKDHILTGVKEVYGKIPSDDGSTSTIKSPLNAVYYYYDGVMKNYPYTTSQGFSTDWSAWQAQKIE